jgi:hypothetical protein
MPFGLASLCEALDRLLVAEEGFAVGLCYRTATLPETHSKMIELGFRFDAALRELVQTRAPTGDRAPSVPADALA